jgi:hypothetical protein
MNHRRVLCAVLTVVTLVGCQYDPWAGRFLTRQPAEQNVVGYYAVDQASLLRTIKLPRTESPIKINPTARIHLAADHKAEFVDVPGELDGFLCSVTGRGTWRLGKNNNFIVVVAQIVDEEPSSRCKGTFTANYGNEFALYGDKPPYRLHLTIGDPDSGDAVQFERRN